MRLSENFMAQFDEEMRYKPEMAEFESEAKNVVMEPLTKPNYIIMSKISKLEKSMFQTVL